MFHSKVVSQVWACLYSHCWGHIQKGVSSHGRQGWMFNNQFQHISKSEPLPTNIRQLFIFFCLFLDAIESPSTYPCGSVSRWSVMFSDFGDSYRIYRACRLVLFRKLFYRYLTGYGIMAGTLARKFIPTDLSMNWRKLAFSSNLYRVFF